MSVATALTEGAVLAMTGATPASSATARSRLQLDRALAVQGAAPAAYVDMETLLGGAEGSSEAKARVADILRTFGAVQAKVVHAAPDGTHTLDIGGARVTLKLNALRAPGDTVVIALQGQGDTTAPETAGVTLSPAARMLATLLDAGAAGRPAGSPTQATGSRPVDTAPVTPAPNDPGGLAAGLQQALSESGLFYESHLAGWVQGRRGLQEIRREPQGRLAPAGDDDRNTDLPQGMGKLVASQLEVLEQHAVGWNGMVWPGQTASIRISEPAAGEDDRDATDESQDGEPGGTRNWSARIAMTLPSLGAVDARVTLAEGRVSVRLEGSSAAGASLAAHRTELAAALAARGLNPGEIRLARQAGQEGTAKAGASA